MIPFHSSLFKALTLVISTGLGLLCPRALPAQTITFVTASGGVQHMDLSVVESMVFRNNHAVVNTEACTHQHFNIYHHSTIALPGLDLEPECPGDLNNDGSHNAPDVLAMLSEFGCTSNCSADLDGDGSVSVADILNLLTLFGGDCP